MRFALLPAANSLLDDDAHQKLRERVNRVWGRIVHLVITLFLVTGFYNYLTLIHGWGGRTPWPLGKLKADYEALFGLKVLLALWVFFLASALAGRAKVFAGMRKNARLWLTVLIVSLLVILMISNAMRALRDRAVFPPAAAVPTAATIPASAPATIPATTPSL